MNEEIEMDVSDIEDFDLTESRYEVWLLAEDENGEWTGWDMLVGEYKAEELEPAVDRAEEVYEDPSTVLANAKLPDNAKYLVIQVETVIDEDGAATNLGNVYHRKIELI